MATRKPLTRAQIDRLIGEAEHWAHHERDIADRLRTEPDKQHFAWRFDHAAMWWRDLSGALAFGEDRLSAGQRLAVGWLLAELKNKRSLKAVA